MAQFDALIKRYNEAQKKIDSRTGLICAVIANVNRDPKKKRGAYKPSDFMPSEKSQKGSLPTVEEMRLINIAAGGDDVFPDLSHKIRSQEELKAIVQKIERDALNGK